MLEDTIEDSKDLPNQIAETGKVSLTKKQIHMFIGHLFLLRINIHLQGSVLDAPELMWAEPQLEPVYLAVRSYLEMDQRLRLLTERLTVIGDLLSVLKDQLSHSHDVYLEWIGMCCAIPEICFRQTLSYRFMLVFSHANHFPSHFNPSDIVIILIAAEILVACINIVVDIWADGL